MKISNIIRYILAFGLPIYISYIYYMRVHSLHTEDTFLNILFSVAVFIFIFSVSSALIDGGACPPYDGD